MKTTNLVAMVKHKTNLAYQSIEEPGSMVVSMVFVSGLSLYSTSLITLFLGVITLASVGGGSHV